MKNILNKKVGFIILMIISTLSLAGSAAYYSVSGLSSLFAGASFAVMIMAGTLEFSKIIVASYLHNHWKVAGWMKYYLTLAVLILMVITSAGIYGFLTTAYQKTSDKLTIVDKRVKVIELKKDRFLEQLNGYTLEKKDLSKVISELSKGLSNNVIQYKDKETGQIITTTSSSTRRALQAELDDSKAQRSVVSQKIESMTDSVTSLELKILDLESNNEATSEVGPLRYLSKITGKSMDVIVNWFTLLIVFVFDPLAIAMVIALNKLIATKTKEQEVEIKTEPAKPKPIPQENPKKKKEIKVIDYVKVEPKKEEPKPEENLYNEQLRKKTKRKGKYSDGDSANTGK